jgi:hypothetical protein
MSLLNFLNIWDIVKITIFGLEVWLGKHKLQSLQKKKKKRKPISRLAKWLKWQSTCLANLRP